MDDEIRKFRNVLNEDVEDFCYKKGDTYQYDVQSGRIIQKYSKK